MKKILSIMVLVMLSVSLCFANGAQETNSDGPVTIEFIQWWEPELPEGSLRAIMDEFEAQNPDIKVNLVSGPFSSTHDQLVTGAATGTLSDVVGLDGAWVSELVDQGALLPLDDYIDSGNLPREDIAAPVSVNGDTYMMAITTFVYYLFVNNDILEEAGVEIPATRSEFLEAGKKITNPDENVYSWIFPFSLLYPSASQDQLMTWVWANGGRMLDENGNPNLVGNQEIIDVLQFILDCYNAGIMSPGVLSKQSQDMTDEFATERAAFMVNGLSLVSTLRDRNPDLDFSVAPMPVADDFTGTSGLMYAPWGVGVSASSEHPDEAWRLVEYLMSPEVNAQIAELASGLPGNKTAVAESDDPAFQQGQAIFQNCELINEFIGMPVASELQRIFGEEVQAMIEQGQSIEETLQNVQDSWNDTLGL